MKTKFLALALSILTAMPCALRAEEKEDDYSPLLDNTLWTAISYGFEPPIIASLYHNDADTIIGGKVYRVIKKDIINIDDATFFSHDNEKTYLYEDKQNKRIYAYDKYSNQDMLLYDFSLQVGDKLPGDSSYTILSITKMAHKGYTRKYFSFVNASSDTIQWIEGIGNYTDLIHPNAIKHSNVTRILCVHKNDEAVYDTGNFLGKTCEDINKVYEDLISPEATSNISISTPSATKILRDGQMLILLDKKVYNAQGTRMQ